MAVDKVIDALYGLLLEEFTRARDEAARELGQAGEREDAERVKALRKPSVAAAATNRLVREQRRDVDAFLKAAASLRDAQFAGKGDLAADREREREALDRLIQVGGTLATHAKPEGATPTSGKRPSSKPKRPDNRAARAKLREAQELVTAAEAEEQQAQRPWTHVQKELERARAVAEKAHHDLDRLSAPD